MSMVMEEEFKRWTASRFPIKNYHWHPSSVEFRSALSSNEYFFPDLRFMYSSE